MSISSRFWRQRCRHARSVCASSKWHSAARATRCPSVRPKPSGRRKSTCARFRTAASTPKRTARCTAMHMIVAKAIGRRSSSSSRRAALPAPLSPTLLLLTASLMPPPPLLLPMLLMLLLMLAAASPSSSSLLPLTAPPPPLANTALPRLGSIARTGGRKTAIAHAAHACTRASTVSSDHARDAGGCGSHSPR